MQLQSFDCNTRHLSTHYRENDDGVMDVKELFASKAEGLPIQAITGAILALR